MKFKHDKEFINKVLDAQIRVNEIEQNILKSVCMNSSNTPLGKSLNRKSFQMTDSKDGAKINTKH